MVNFRDKTVSIFIVVLLSMLGMTACTAVQRVNDNSASSTAYIRFNVTPEDAEIYINDDYFGVVQGWTDHTVVISPGKHHLEIKKEGYISQRFDIAINEGEMSVLTLEMEPQIEGFDTN